MDELQRVAAPPLFGRIADDALGRPALVEDAALGVHEHDGVRAVLDEGPEALLACPQGFVRPPAVGDVAAEALHPCRLAVAADEPAADLQRHASAVLGHDLELVGAAFGIAGELAADHLLRTLQVLGRHHLAHVQLQGLGAGVSGDPLAGPVERGEVAGEVVGVDDVVRVLDDLLVALLAAPQLLLGLPAALGLPFEVGALHGPPTAAALRALGSVPATKTSMRTPASPGVAGWPSASTGTNTMLAGTG